MSKVMTVAELAVTNELANRYKEAKAAVNKFANMCSATIYFSGFNSLDLSAEDSAAVRNLLLSRLNVRAKELLKDLQAKGVSVRDEMQALEEAYQNAIRE